MGEVGEQSVPDTEPEPGRQSASSCNTSLSTPWLFLLICWEVFGYYLFPDRWASSMSGLGLLGAVLLWTQRGPRYAVRWFITLWGVSECLQVFVCQGLLNWFPLHDGENVCASYFGGWLDCWGIVCAAALDHWLARTIK